MSNFNDFEIQNGILNRYNGDEAIVAIPDCVTRIGDYAFDNCTSLKSVTIPDSVSVIGERAFFKCSGLEDVAIPDSVTSIGVRAFDECSSLTNIKIPDSVMNIGNYAFSGCKGITELIIPDGVTVIDSGVFYNCESLEEINIPDGVTELGWHAFYGCSSLKKVLIPDSVSSIKNNAFWGCESLTEISIPDGVTSIEDDTFSACDNLTNITFPESLTNIGKHAFRWCDGLTHIVIPNSVTSIGIEAFKSCDGLTSVELPNSLISIGGGAFNCCSNLTEISIPDGVKSIGWSAFSGCKNLKSITIPDSVTMIGNDGSYYQKVYSNGPYIFDENTEVVFTAYVKGVGNNDVSQRLVFRKSPITEIKSTNTKGYAVNGFLTTEDLSIYDDSVIDSYKKYLKGKVVNYMDFILKNDPARIVERLDSLGLLDSRFVEKMMEHSLPDEVKAILSKDSKNSQVNKEKPSDKKALSVSELKKRWSFKKNEEGLTITSYKDIDTEVVIPDKIGKDAVTEIGEQAFSKMKSGISDAQRDTRTSITTVTIPEGVTSIGYCAFEGCRSLESIIIPNSVTDIHPHAFYGCYGVTIHAPAGSFAEEYAKANDSIKFEAL